MHSYPSNQSLDIFHSDFHNFSSPVKLLLTWLTIHLLHRKKNMKHEITVGREERTRKRTLRIFTFPFSLLSPKNTSTIQRYSPETPSGWEHLQKNYSASLSLCLLHTTPPPVSWERHCPVLSHVKQNRNAQSPHHHNCSQGQKYLRKEIHLSVMNLKRLQQQVFIVKSYLEKGH